MDPRYQVYKYYRRIMETKYDDESNREFFAELGDMMDREHPEFRIQYDHEKRTQERFSAMQKTFTREQQDFICWQIGEWYVYWKSHILDGCNGREHRLGFAKEQLKTMICGDGDELS